MTVEQCDTGGQDASAWVGRSQEQHDRVWPPLLRGMAATLGVKTPDTLPPLWHWMLFQDWVPPDGIGPDGHPRRGGFLPPLHDLPRRMWAGGRVQFLGPLRSDDRVSRTSTILSVAEKSGGSGRLVFVTVRHEIVGPSGPAVVEEQDLVYRGTEGAAVKVAEPAPVAPLDAASQTTLPDPVLLFRYSALTGNGHRIHYDADYVRVEEGYPGLVVHGPLQATLMAGLAGRIWPQQRLGALSFRGRRPAFSGKALRVEGWQANGGVQLRTLNEDGALCMSAEAAFA